MLLGMLIVLTSSSSLLFFLLNQNLNTSSRMLVNSELSVIRNLLKQTPYNFSALDEEIVATPKNSKYQYFAKIVNSSGQIIKATPDIDSVISASTWPLIENGDNTSPLKKITVKDKTYVLQVVAVKVTASNELFKVYLAYDVSHDEEILENFVSDLLTIALIGLFLALLMSFSLIKLGLKPLAAFIKNIEAMEPNNIKPIAVQQAFSEVVPLIEAFNHLLRRIKDGYEQLADFSSNIAHELRTPINNLMVTTEVLLSRPLSGVNTHKLLSSSLEEYQRLASIIEKLLFLARSEAKKLYLNKVELDFAKEVKAVVEFHEAFAAEESINIEVIGAGVAAADQTLLRNAITNLLSNAIKYSGKDSNITIHISENMTQLKVSVLDDGPGFPPEHLARITERFYRVDNHRALIIGGSGLGLAIVEMIMQAHEGHLEICPNLPHGVIATLTFPKHRQ